MNDIGMGTRVRFVGEDDGFVGRGTVGVVCDLGEGDGAPIARVEFDGHADEFVECLLHELEVV